MHVCFLQTIHTLCGHSDFSFTSAGNPNNQTFTIGNQDMTCRVWDIRNFSKSVVVLRGNMAAIRCICYTSDGKFMAMSKNADFLHIFDVTSRYMRRQEVEFFGDVSSISFSPDPKTNNHLMEFRHQQDFSYLDSVM
jgi:WD40 repeat protein